VTLKRLHCKFRWLVVSRCDELAKHFVSQPLRKVLPIDGGALWIPVIIVTDALSGQWLTDCLSTS